MAEKFENDLLAMVCGLSLGMTLGLGVTASPERWQAAASALCVSSAVEAGQDALMSCQGESTETAWTIAQR